MRESSQSEFKMKEKRILVLGIALIILAVVAGAAFAETTDGVVWSFQNDNTSLYNSTGNTVYVQVTFINGQRSDWIQLSAGGRDSVYGQASRIFVTRIRPANF